MTDTGIARQAQHMHLLKHITHQAVRLTQTKAVFVINGDDARRILPTML